MATGPDSDSEAPVINPTKGKRKAVEEKHGKAGEKRRKSKKKKSLITLLKSQQEMMKSEEQDRLAMQQLMKFEVEAEKRHQEFTLAALKELGNIFKKD